MAKQKILKDRKFSSLLFVKTVTIGPQQLRKVEACDEHLAAIFQLQESTRTLQVDTEIFDYLVSTPNLNLPIKLCTYHEVLNKIKCLKPHKALG